MEQKLTPPIEEARAHGETIASLLDRLEESKSFHETLFSTYFRDELARIIRKLLLCLEKSELHVECRRFESVGAVLDEVLRAPSSTIRDVWVYESGEKLFDDVPWKQYFTLSIQLAIKGELEFVRSLLVIDDPAELSEPRLEMLVDFYHSIPRVECRVIGNHIYAELVRKSRLREKILDFGIYGGHLVFVTERYAPSAGVFLGDDRLVSRFVELYDSMWDEAEIPVVSHAVARSPSLDELFAFDSSASS